MVERSLNWETRDLALKKGLVIHAFSSLGGHG